MSGYDFEFIYEKGKLNVVADALSRKDEEVEALLCAISIIHLDWITKAREEWKNDEELWTLIQKLQRQIPVHLIHLARKNIHYDTNITYIFVITPN